MFVKKIAEIISGDFQSSYYSQIPLKPFPFFRKYFSLLGFEQYPPGCSIKEECKRWSLFVYPKLQPLVAAKEINRLEIMSNLVVETFGSHYYLEITIGGKNYVLDRTIGQFSKFKEFEKYGVFARLDDLECYYPELYEYYGNKYRREVSEYEIKSGDPTGTRTPDLLRDRQAF